MSRAEPNFILMVDDEAPSPVDQLRRRALRLLQAAESEEVEKDGQRRAHSGFAAPAAFSPPRPEPARALAVGIVTMPAVFILVVMAALALFGKPASAPNEDRSAATTDTLEQPVARTAAVPTFVSQQTSPAVAIGEDRRITGISLDGDRVAMQIESPAGTEIVIFNFVEGRIIASTPIVTASTVVDDQLSSLIGAPPAQGPVVNLSVVVPSTGSPAAPAIKPRSAD